jgi:hypothetical protein
MYKFGKAIFKGRTFINYHKFLRVQCALILTLWCILLTLLRNYQAHFQTDSQQIRISVYICLKLLFVR